MNNTGTATAIVSNIQVICPAVFHTIGGQVVGLYVPTGQTSNMVIQNNGGDNLPITGNGAFTFVTPIANGSAYDVTTLVQENAQPQGCIIWGWNGVAISNVTDVTVDCGHNDWTYMDGQDTANHDAQITKPPVDHTVQDKDTPGASKYSATWTDLNGNLWLFSGSSHATGQTNVTQFFNQMWEYTDSNYLGGLGNYWTMVPPAGGSSIPTPRWGAVTWTDSAGNFWLFGGQDLSLDFLNDLWFYTPSTSTWTLVGGGFNQNGTYGTKGTAKGGFPGGRWASTARKDAAGTVWLFGGFGYGDASSANVGLLNDLWKYSGGQWTWVSGSSVLNTNGVYGTEGTAAAANVPGGRQAPVSWIDNSGNFWMPRRIQRGYGWPAERLQ